MLHLRLLSCKLCGCYDLVPHAQQHHGAHSGSCCCNALHLLSPQQNCAFHSGMNCETAVVQPTLEQLAVLSSVRNWTKAAIGPKCTEIPTAVTLNIKLLPFPCLQANSAFLPGLSHAARHIVPPQRIAPPLFCKLIPVSCLHAKPCLQASSASLIRTLECCQVRACPACWTWASATTPTAHSWSPR
jgi:hypothetical protein